MTVADVLDAFFAWCGEHRSAATVRFYRGRLSLLLRKYGDRELTTLTPLEVEAWLREAGRRPDGTLKAPDTRRSNAVSFDRFQAWAVERRVLTGKILDKIERPRGRRRERIPTAAETNAIRGGADPAFRLIYEALRRCGARPNELCRARISDWDHQVGAIILVEHKTAAKTGRPRRIPIGKQLARLLLEAIGDRPEGPIFLTARGQAWTPSGLSRVFRRIRDRLGLPRDLCLYLARHEHATFMCESKGIHAAAEALGHSNLATTQRYVKKSLESMQQNQDSLQLPGDEPPEAKAA